VEGVFEVIEAHELPLTESAEIQKRFKPASTATTSVSGEESTEMARTVHTGGVAGGSGSSVISDEDTLRAMREGCRALQELWPAGRDASLWAGVTFGDAGGNGEGRMVGLFLTLRLGDAVEVPAALWGLTALMRLRLDGNQLTSLPAALGALTALRTLNLDGNRLTSLPAELGALTALTELHLNRNKLSSLPAELGALTALTFLRLESNRLTSLPTELGALTALLYLHLDGNRLTSLPAELGALTALTHLGLNGNQLTSLPAELGALSALMSLDLASNRLTSLPAELGALSALRTLYLDRNQLTKDTTCPTCKYIWKAGNGTRGQVSNAKKNCKEKGERCITVKVQLPVTQSATKVNSTDVEDGLDKQLQQEAEAAEQEEVEGDPAGGAAELDEDNLAFKVLQLESCGIPDGRARELLAKNNGDVDAAITLIFRQRDMDQENQNLAAAMQESLKENEEGAAKRDAEDADKKRSAPAQYFAGSSFLANLNEVAGMLLEEGCASPESKTKNSKP
jgi:Leucine-rich repeat (LRR) protein